MNMEKFVGKIKVVWKHFNGNLRQSTPLQFQKSSKEEKNIVANCERDKNLKYDRVLREVEEALEVLYNEGGFSVYD